MDLSPGRLRRPARLLSALAVTAALGGGLAACGSDDDSSSSTAAAAGTGTAAASAPAELEAGTVKLGLATALTGYLAPYNAPLNNGIKLAVEQINARGGIGGSVRIDLAEGDVKSDPATAGTVAQQLVDGGADVLVSLCDTDSQVSIAAVAQRTETINISPCNADPTIPSKFDAYWPVAMGANAQTAVLADQVKAAGARNVWILEDSGVLYIRLISDYFEKAAESRGLTVVGTDTFRTGSKDFAAQIAKLDNASPKPHAIVSAMLTPDVATFLRQLRAAGVDTPFYGTDGFDSQLTLRVGGEAVDGSTFTTFGFPTPGSPTEAFYADYRAKYGQDPDGAFAALGSSAIQVLASAIETARSTDSKAIATALSDGLRVETPLGEVAYPGGGEHIPAIPVQVTRVDGGRFVSVANGPAQDVPAP